MTTGQSNRIKCVCYNNLLNNPFIALKIQLPDFDPAETFPLRTNWQYIGHIPRCAWRKEMFADDGIHLPDLFHLIKRGPPYLFLGIVAEPHGILVPQIQQIP